MPDCVADDAVRYELVSGRDGSLCHAAVYGKTYRVYKLCPSLCFRAKGTRRVKWGNSGHLEAFSSSLTFVALTSIDGASRPAASANSSTLRPC